MAKPLPSLRSGLQFLPSPSPEEHPGAVVRDLYDYAGNGDMLPLLEPAVVQCLRFYDGNHTDLDLREMLVRATGDVTAGQIVDDVTALLSAAGFLDDENFRTIRDAKHREFAEASVREPSHAGAGYPEDPAELRDTLAAWLATAPSAAPPDGLVGIAAPHVDPDGGRKSYAAAYASLGEGLRDRTFVILGTSHYGDPGRYGLTRKPFRTPLGEAVTQEDLVGRLAAKAGDAVRMEDYCYKVEHSIEFQVIFLQHLLGPEVRILPILCGSFGYSIIGGKRPEDEVSVGRFLQAIRELAEEEGDRLFWIIGVDMAHLGLRYGDRTAVTADTGPMVRVGERDRERIGRIVEGDADGFWKMVLENRDDLSWCGTSPLYTFLRAVPEARGDLLHYEQWNIDEGSVVTFGALGFRR